jgi:hypothetical protein
MAIFSLDVSDFIAILALCVAGGSSIFTAFTYLKTYSRNRKSEQIKIAREIQDKMNIAVDARREFTTTKYEYPDSMVDKIKWIDELASISYRILAPVAYLAYLVEQKEIDDRSVLNYYKKSIQRKFELIENSCAIMEQKIKDDTTLAKYRSSLVTELRSEILRHKKVWEGSSDSGDEIVLPPEDL